MNVYITIINCLNLNMSSVYYEKLRTVYEHHLDERILDRHYNFPSPKNMLSPPMSTVRNLDSN